MRRVLLTIAMLLMGMALVAGSAQAAVAPTEIALSIDQLDMDTHSIAGFAHRAFENVRYAKLLCDLGDVFG